MKFQFYTFGVPEGFDLYPADADKIGYFQRYYDGSSEDEKLSVLRSGNAISYSYLRYNHIGSRTGSFFGMSLLFEGQYCTDAEKLYKLFGELYAAVLQQGVLLKKTESGQPQFGVSALKNAANVIDAVKNNIQAIIDSQFAADFKPLDSSFKQGVNLDKVMQLNDKAGNAAFLAALREFPMISISPAFKGGIIEKIPQKEIDALVEYGKKVEQESGAIESASKIVANSFSALSLIFSEDEKKRKLQEIAPQYNNVVDSIGELLGKCDAMQRTVAKYQKTEPNLWILAETARQVAALKTKLDSEKQALLPFASAVSQVGGGTTGGGGTGTTGKGGTDTTGKGGTGTTGGGGQKPIPWWKRIFNDENKPRIIATCVIVALLAVAAYFVVPYLLPEPAPTQTENSKETGEQTQEEKNAKLVEEGNKALNNNEFDKAIEKFQQANKTDLVNAAKQIAQKYYEDEGTKHKNKQQWQEAIEFFESAKRFGSNYADNEIKECQKKINAAGQQQRTGNPLSVKVESVDNKALENNVVNYNGTTAKFRVKVTGHIGGKWSCNSSNVQITEPNNADTEVKINNPENDASYTLTFTDGRNYSKQVSVTTKLKASSREQP